MAPNYSRLPLSEEHWHLAGVAFDFKLVPIFIYSARAQDGPQEMERN